MVFNTNGGLGDFFITACKMSLDGHKHSDIDSRHSDNGQVIHKDNITKLANEFFGFKSFEFHTQPLKPEHYSTFAEDRFDNFPMWRNLTSYDDHIAIQSAAGAGVNVQHTRTWNGFDINGVIRFYAPKYKIYIVGTDKQSITYEHENVEYFIGRDLIDAMDIVGRARLFIGFDGLFSYVRAFSNGNQLLRKNKNWDYYYSNPMRKHVYLYEDMNSLIKRMKDIL
jgi:hypothetical protein